MLPVTCSRLACDRSSANPAASSAGIGPSTPSAAAAAAIFSACAT